ncbi:MAG: ThiF family adenylyltransferase [Planctomycetes bacterium]|nr:ThiF family adenylyltransferase [Planctomycetota bacterium]
MFGLRVAAAAWEAIRSRLAARPARVVEVTCGWRRDRAGIEYLVGPSHLERRPTASEPRVRVGVLRAGLEGIDYTYWKTFPLPRLEAPTIEIGLHGERGFTGAWFLGADVRALNELVIVGPSMRRLRSGRVREEPSPRLPRDEDTRLAGGFGGDGTLEMLRDTNFLVAGLGRTGSVLAHSIARYRPRRPLAVLDPDVMEPHNVDAMDVDAREGERGQTKVRAFGSFLRHALPGTPLCELAVDGTSPDALDHWLAADVLVTAPDHDALRLHATTLAALYLKPHLDIGTGVRRTRSQLLLGADVRLTLPGERCLLCLGGLNVDRPRRNAWNDGGRAGSRRSLNVMAAHMGLLLLEELHRGTLRHGVWRRLTVRDGIPRWSTPREAPGGACALCARAGEGDAAWERAVAREG